MGKPKGRIYFDPLNGHFTYGTFKDLEEENITPVEGMTLPFWNDDADENGNTDNLIFEGVIHFDRKSGRWFAVIDERTYRHESDDSERGKNP
jgi:hypothetical protein